MSNKKPKLRLLESHWIDNGGQPALLLQDRLGLGARAVVVPRPLAPMLALCDGTRDVAGIRAALELWTGVRLDSATVEAALAQLDNALLLDNERYAAAYRQALESYRELPSRPSALAGSSYPVDRAELAALLDGYLSTAHREDGHLTPSRPLRGIICPHIDYERGGEVYAQVWDRAREAVAEADLFVILGTDHAGGPAELTLTRQSFGTPFGLLRTDVEAVDTVVEAMGERAAFASELNHTVEHSIELAAIWLHHLVGARDVRIVPVLCGSFHPFTEGRGRPGDDKTWAAAAGALQEIASRGRTLVIAAADLAHIGPAFGDPNPVGTIEKATLSGFDTEMLATVARGDTEGFLDLLIREQDRYRVCGLPPIYLAMSMMGSVTGEVVAYSQCPAPGESVVSVTGALLYEKDGAR
jgi:MEMO1 family protein